MKKSSLILAAIALVAGAAQSQDMAAARAAYQQQQALAEVPRLVQQFDVLMQNQDNIVARLQRLEQPAGPDANLQAEIATLRAEVADLRAALPRLQEQIRAAVVADLAQRMAKITPPPPPAAVSAPARAPARAPAARPAPPPSVGFHYEWVVEKGQTLSLIAQGFDTTVQKILAANPGLKANNLRVGQKLIIPAEDPPKSAPKAAGRKRR